MTPFKEHSKEGLFYRIGGEGPNLVMLRGLGRWSRHWCGLDERLAHDFTVITIDNRGFGGSKAAHLGWSTTTADLAQDICTVLDQISAQKCHVLGVSLGGMVGMSLALHTPARVESLTVVNSSVAGSPFPRITRQAVQALLAAAYKPKTVHDDLARVLLGPSAPQHVRADLARTWREIDFDEGVSFINLIKQLLAARSFAGKELALGISPPTQIIKSLGDQFVDPRCSDWIQSLIPQAQMIEHQTAGHELGFEDPEWICERLKKFTQGAGAPTVSK